MLRFSLFLLILVGTAQAGIVKSFPPGSFTYVANQYGNDPDAWEIKGPFTRGYRHVKAEQAYYLDYWLKLKPGWVEGRGGKVLGLGPKRPTTGCKPITKEGWSVRMMWGPLRSYEYHQKRKAKCGDNNYWSTYEKLPVDKWTRITQYVRVNDIGKANGTVTWWIDGVRRSHQTNRELRGKVSPGTGLIERVLILPFRGGNNDSWSVPVDTTMQFSTIYALDCPPNFKVGSPTDEPQCERDAPEKPLFIAIPAGKNPVLTVTDKVVKVEFK